MKFTFASAFLLVAMVAPAAAAQGYDLTVVSEKCVKVINAPQGAKMVEYRSSGKTWSSKKLGACYRPIWNAQGVATVQFKIYKRGWVKVGSGQKVVTKPGVVNASVAVSTVDPALTQCQTDLKNCLDAKAKPRVKADDWWRNKKLCATKGKKTGLTAWNNNRKQCVCEPGFGWQGLSRGRCVKGGTIRAPSDDVLRRLTALEKDVGALKANDKVQDNRLKVVEDDMRHLKKQGPGVDQVARDEIKKLAEKVTKTDQNLSAIADTLRLKPQHIASATTEEHCKKIGGTWTNGACVLVTQETRFQLVPRLGFSLIGLGSKEYHVGKVEVEGRFWATKRFVLKMSSGVGLRHDDNPSFTASGGFEFFPTGGVVGFGFAVRYWAFAVRPSSFGAKEGQALEFEPQLVLQPLSWLHIAIGVGGGMLTTPAGWTGGLVLNVSVGFTLPAK